MKDKQNLVYAVQVSKQNSSVLEGFLLFENELKGKQFSEKFVPPKEYNPYVHSGSTYTPHGYVNVSDFYMDSISNRGNFFVRSLEYLES